MSPQKLYSGFTLIELLITLVIMGVIATFSIPKVLCFVQGSDHKSRVQLAAAMISAAFTRYQENNNLTGSFKPSDLTPYMSYISLITNGSLTVDGNQNSSQTWICSASTPCAKLANGSVVVFYDAESFGSIAPGRAIIFVVDPDGRITDGTTNGPGRGPALFLYPTNGRLVDYAGIDDPTCAWQIAGAFNTCRNPTPTAVPSWFGWN